MRYLCAVFCVFFFFLSVGRSRALAEFALALAFLASVASAGWSGLSASGCGDQGMGRRFGRRRGCSAKVGLSLQDGRQESARPGDVDLGAAKLGTTSIAAMCAAAHMPVCACLRTGSEHTCRSFQVAQSGSRPGAVPSVVGAFFVIFFVRAYRAYLSKSRGSGEQGEVRSAGHMCA